MTTFPKVTFSIAFFFACICYAVCSFFVPTKYAILFSLFTGALYYLVFSIWDRVYSKQAVKLLDALGVEPLYKYIVNYNDNDSKRLRNGWLVLTKTELLFIDLEKKKSPPVRIPVRDIVGVEYSANLKPILGILVEKTDGAKLGFNLPPQELEPFKTAWNAVQYGE